jgi:hypothetical protein
MIRESQPRPSWYFAAPRTAARITMPMENQTAPATNRLRSICSIASRRASGSSTGASES